MLVIPFISCSAKLPVYVLLISAFFKPAQAGNILFGIYMFGVLIALLMARILKKVVFQDDSEPFVMELPPYRLPSLKNLLIHTWEKVWMYLRKAGTILLGFAVLIWLISNFPVNMAVEKDYQTKIQLIQLGRTFSERQKETQISELSQVRAAAQLEYSIAGRAGKIIEPLIKPLGFNWKIGIALIAGFSAKEVVVSTLGTIYSLGEEHRSTTTNKLVGALRQSPDFNPLVALSLMIFVLLYVPCMAATAVFHKEAGSWRWTWFYIFYTTGTAYLLSLLVYQLGKIFFKL